MRVPGKYIDRDQFAHPIVVVGLSSMECQLAGECSPAAPGSEISFWIGAVGPFSGRAERRAQDGLHVRFTDPVDPMIVEHFAAS